MAKHLLLKNGRLYFRRRIPSRLTTQLGHTDFVRLMPPCSYHVAVQVARALSAQLDQAFSQAMTDSTFDRDKLNEIARHIFNEFLVDYDLRNSGRHTEAGAEINARRIEGSRELLRMKFWEDAKPVVDATLHELDIGVTPSGTDYRELCLLALRAFNEAARISAARYDGDYTITPADPVFKDPLTEQGAIARTIEKKPPQSISLSTAFDRYCTEKKRDAWRSASIKEAKNAYRLILHFFRDCSLADISKRDVSAFVAMLRRLPVKRGRNNELRGKTLDELMDMVDAGTLEAISEATVGKHYKHFSALLDWAVQNGEIEVNQAKGVFKQRKRKKNVRDERKKWSTQHLQSFFSCPIYRGCSSKSHRLKPGNHVFKNCWYWWPLFMAFHPVRPEEVAQLRTEDIYSDDGILAFNVMGGVTTQEVLELDRSVKNLSSNRPVPVHSIVLELGFEPYLKEIISAGHERLFPDIKKSWDGTYNQYICRYINENRERLGLAGVSAYGLRHSAITALANSCPDITMRTYLQGHALEGMQNRYIKGFEISRLKEAIDGIQYPGIDADFIRGV
jgi:integrase